MAHESPMSNDPGRLARRLGMGDAVVIGLGAMLGAGIFAAPGPAAAAAGPWLLAGLGLAAIVAWCNATSSARLAAHHPEAGGTYVYAREHLGTFWGFLAGWAFVIGKLASLAAMALTFGAYVAPDFARPVAVAAVVAMTVTNYLGVEKTARLTRVIVTVVLVALAVVVAGSLSSDSFDVAAHLTGDSPGGVGGVVQSAGLLFFAFAGYARLATLGEEVRDPTVTIPRAIGLALGAVVVIYGIVLASSLAAVGAETLATSASPLSDAVASGRLAVLEPVVRVGAGVASAGVLLSLLAGVSRTVLAMARRGELPRFLDAVHPTRRTPHRAEMAAGLVVAALVLFADLRGAIGFSSFAVLGYYTLTNLSAWRLARRRSQPPSLRSALGAVLCVVLAAALPAEAVIGGVVLLVIGSMMWLATIRRGTRGVIRSVDTDPDATDHGP